MFQDANTYNCTLTEYAQAAWADDTESIGKLLFPAVKVPTATGEYKKRDIDNAYRAYDATLARGTTPKRIDTNATKAFFSCKPQALAVGTWKFDMEQDGGDSSREDNVQDLMSTQLITREEEAVRIFKEGVPAMSNAGAWSTDEDADIIGQLDAAILQIYAAIGHLPTHMVIGLRAWSIIKNHPSMVRRVQGLEVAVTLTKLKEALIHPGIDIRVASIPWQPGARGTTGDKEVIAGDDIFIFYTQDHPTRNDMSVGKDFTTAPDGPEVTSREDEDKLETVDTLYWSTDRQVTCPAAAARIEVA